MKSYKVPAQTLMWAIIWAVIILVSFPAAAQEPASASCPSGHAPIAKWERDRWDSAGGFETGFEFGSEYIWVSRVFFDGTDDLLEVNWFVAPGSLPVTYVLVKAGDTAELTEFVPALTNADGEQLSVWNGINSISNILWCSKQVPTAITLVNVSAKGVDYLPYIALVGALAGLGLVLSGAWMLSHKERDESDG